MEIQAHSVRFENDGYCTIFALANDPVEPTKYAILQMINAPSSQDLQLKHGGVHLEVDEQRSSGYGLLDALEATQEGVLLLLNEEAASRLGLAQRLMVKFVSADINTEEVQHAVEVFMQRLREHADRKTGVKS